jgi:hypothetical protein
VCNLGIMKVMSTSTSIIMTGYCYVGSHACAGRETGMCKRHGRGGT